MIIALTFTAVLLLALIHLFVHRLIFLDKYPKAWKSFSGGVCISYAFLVLLPKLASSQLVLEQVTESNLFGFLAHHCYLVALAGLVVYYSLDVFVNNLSERPDLQHLKRYKLFTSIHGCGISGYYFLISFVMLEARQFESSGVKSLAFFAGAMLLHYTSIAHNLRQRYGAVYDHTIRWVLATAILTGWGAAFVIKVSYPTLAIVYSFFAGALLVFVMKDKMPGGKYFRLPPFLGGVLCYSALLLIVEMLK